MSTKSKRKPEAEKSKPELHIRVGGVRIPIWKNEGENGPYFKAGQPELSYMSSNDEWQTAKSYGTRDLINLIKAAALAHSELLRLGNELSETDTQSESE